MPRNRAVDYPAVRPPTSQPHLELAPPQQPYAAEQNRFSWQQTPVDSVVGYAERQFEEKKAARAEDTRQSRLPALPVLPDHLNSGLQQQIPAHPQQTQAVLPSQRSAQFQTQSSTLSQQQQQQQQQEQEQQQFRPDFPRNWQQQQPHYRGPTPSYEASQAEYTQAELQQAKMQEQAMYPSPYNGAQQQLSVHALPIHQRQQLEAAQVEHQSSEHKPPQPDANSQPQQPLSVHLGPDANPLSPNSPLSATSPSNTTNIRTFPPATANDMQFPQPTSYSQANTQSGKGGSWHHSLGSCAEPTTCLSSLFCPCVVYGRTQYRLSQKSAKKDPTNLLGYSTVNSSCVAWSVLCGVNILLSAVQRTRIRKTYEMDSQAGNVASDCLKSVCCCCCIIAQNEKEMKVREEGGTNKATMDVGYTTPTAMTFGPPPR